MLDGGLSVRETLTFAAALRVDLRRAARDAQVDRVVEALELDACAASRCAVLSGGECRRVSVGEELVGSPAILWCDEPTTGLDSATALAMLATLARLPARRGVGVAMSLHQPPYAVFEPAGSPAALLDAALLLRAGEVAF
jgi:ATP-binding cassette subfamily G (WHITE) protein 2